MMGLEAYYDFLVFINYTLHNRALPELGELRWDKLLRYAADKICFPFCKSDAIEKYGEENVYAT